MTSEDRCALSDIPAELRRRYGQTASYSVLWKAAVEGDFPAERVRNRWFVRRSDLPRVAQVLGIPTASAARPPPQRDDGAHLPARS
jgi:hypothetical protein